MNQNETDKLRLTRWKMVRKARSKRLVSLLLSLALFVGVTPPLAFAESQPQAALVEGPVENPGSILLDTLYKIDPLEVSTSHFLRFTAEEPGVYALFVLGKEAPHLVVEFGSFVHPEFQPLDGETSYDPLEEGEGVYLHEIRDAGDYWVKLDNSGGHEEDWVQFALTLVESAQVVEPQASKPIDGEPEYGDEGYAPEEEDSAGETSWDQEEQDSSATPDGGFTVQGFSSLQAPESSIAMTDIGIAWLVASVIGGPLHLATQEPGGVVYYTMDPINNPGDPWIDQDGSPGGGTLLFDPSNPIILETVPGADESTVRVKAMTVVGAGTPGAYGSEISQFSYRQRFRKTFRP